MPFEKFEGPPMPSEEKPKKEEIEEAPEEDVLKEKAEKKTELSQETKDEIEEFLRKGFEKAEKQAREYTEEEERQKDLSYEHRRHISVDDAVYERVAAYGPYAYFSDALKGFKKGDYSPVIEVLEKYKIEEEEKLSSYRGGLNINRLDLYHAEKQLDNPRYWMSKDEIIRKREEIERKREELNKKIEEIDKKIEDFKAKRTNWAEQLRELSEQP